MRKNGKEKETGKASPIRKSPARKEGTFPRKSRSWPGWSFPISPGSRDDPLDLPLERFPSPGELLFRQGGRPHGFHLPPDSSDKSDGVGPDVVDCLPDIDDPPGAPGIRRRGEVPIPGSLDHLHQPGDPPTDPANVPTKRERSSREDEGEQNKNPPDQDSVHDPEGRRKPEVAAGGGVPKRPPEGREKE